MNTTGLSLKIIGAIVLAVLFIVPVVAYHNVTEARRILEKAHLEKAITKARLLDAGVYSVEDLNDKDLLFEIVQRHLWLEPDTLSIDINLKTPDGLKIVVSSEGDNVGKPADSLNWEAYRSNQILTEVSDNDGMKCLRVITPIHIAQTVYGTFKLDISMENVDQRVATSIYSLVAGYLAIIAVFILFGYLLIHRIVLTPLKSLEKGMQAMSRGELDHHVSVKSNDEIGRVTEAFNAMSQDLYRSRQQIENNVQAQVALNAQLSESNQKLIEAREKADKSERNYSKLFNLTRDGYAISRGFSSWINANPALLTMLGYSLDELQHLTVKDITPTLNQERIKTDVTTELMSRGFTDLREKEFVHKDGHVFPVQVQSFLLNPQETIDDSLIASFVRDITQIKQTEEALRRSQKMDAIGQLTGGIAHDFNNILGIILGNVSLLEPHAQGDSQISARVEAIGKSARRAAELTRQLLGFSQQQADQVVVTDICQLISGMEELISSSLTPEVEFKLHFEHDLRLTEINPGEFEDALLNLVLNARDAMPNGGKLTIHVRNCTLDNAFCSAHPTMTPGQYIQISIADTGVGIPQDRHSRIFDPFYTTKPHGEGTGLGLSMVFGFINRSQGIILVDSDVGRGCVFTIYLPGIDKAKAQKHHDNFGVDTHTRQKQNDQTILVVDDEVELLELASEALQHAGYNVLAANDSQEALALLTNEPAIELLFSDLVMPGTLNGYELAEQAQTINPDLKILLTSGYNKKTGFYGNHQSLTGHLIQKPYSLSELLHQVQSVLRN